MKLQFLILIILFATLSLNGQDTMKVYSLIDKFSANKNEEFIIAEQMWPNQLNRLQDCLKLNITDYNGNKITLTNEELAFIKKQLEIIGNYKWSNKLIKTTKIIPLDSLKQSTIYKPYWLFSQPIFIRKNTVVLLYAIYYCGTTCGYYDLSFYKWQDNKYIKWVNACGGKG